MGGLSEQNTQPSVNYAYYLRQCQFSKSDYRLQGESSWLGVAIKGIMNIMLHDGQGRTPNFQ